MKSDLNLKHLRALLVVADCQSISLAAERFHLSQPAITRAIANIEEQLGVRLFERDVAGTFVTPEGEAVCRCICDAFSTLHAGLERVVPDTDPEHLSRVLKGISATQLRALEAIVETGSCVLASQRLSIALSSVHKSIKELAGNLGVTLIAKERGGLVPNEVATVFAENACEMLTILRDLQVRFQSSDSDSLLVSVGATPDARDSILPGAIMAFSSISEDFRIRVVDGPFQKLLDDLRNEEIDLFIGPQAKVVNHQGVAWTALDYASSYVVCGRMGHPLAVSGVVSMEELNRFRWLVPCEGEARELFDRLTRQQIISPESFLETNSFNLARTLLMQSDGLVLIAYERVRKEVEAGRLAVIPCRISQASSPMTIITREGWMPSLSQKQFIQALITTTSG